MAEFPFFHLREDFHRHTEFMLFSTAHWQPLRERLQRQHPDGLPRDGAADGSLPRCAVVRRHAGARRAVPPRPHGLLRRRRRDEAEPLALRRIPAAALTRRTRCGSTKSSPGRPRASRRDRAGGAAHVAARDRARPALAHRQRRHAAQRLDPRAGSRTRPCAIRSTSSTRTSSIPSRAPSPSPSTWWCRA